MRSLAIFGLGVMLRLSLIARFPLIFDGDPMVRMLHRDQVLISHQLPLLQLIVYTIARFTHQYVATMCALAVVGALVGVVFYWLARDLVSENAAFWAALVMATNPFVAGDSIVPFQESLMLVTVLLAFHFFYVDRPIESSICIGLACLTRYEAWAAALVLAAAYIYRRGVRPTSILRGLVIYGWAPAAWMLYRHGLSPAGSYVIESHVTAARLMRWVYVGYITVKFTPLLVVGMGVAGLWLMWRLPETRRRQWWPLIFFFGLFNVALLFSAHGDLPDPERRISAREAHFWIVAVVLLAALALERVPRYCAPLAIIGAAFGVWGASQFVAQKAADPHLALSYRMAKLLDGRMRPGERALILAAPWPREAFDFYLQRARETGGEASYQAALKNLAESDLSPPDYQRTLIHSRFDRDRLLSTPGVCTEWLAVWSDYGPAARPPDIVLRAGQVSVNIGQRACK